MHALDQRYKFVVFPKAVIVKGIYYSSNLPQYCLSVFKVDFKEDEITMIPVREQKLYSTYFLFSEGRVEFFQKQGQQRQWVERRLVVYENGIEVGSIRPTIEEYIGNYQDYNSKYYIEKFKIADKMDFQFEVFVGTSDEEVSELILEYKGESFIKTPLTVSSRQAEQQDIDDIDKILAQTKNIKSELYTPTLPRSQRNYSEEEEEQSQVRSSIPFSSPPNRKQDFSIQLRVVPSKGEQTAEGSLRLKSNGGGVLGEWWGLPLRQKVTFLLFGLFSIAMIYISMIPMKKI